MLFSHNTPTTMRRYGEEKESRRRRRRRDRRKRIIPVRWKAIPILGRFTYMHRDEERSFRVHALSALSCWKRPSAGLWFLFFVDEKTRRVFHPSQSAYALHRVPGASRVMAILSRSSSSPSREPVSLVRWQECNECGYTYISFWAQIISHVPTGVGRVRKFRGFLRRWLSRFIADTWLQFNIQECVSSGVKIELIQK